MNSLELALKKQRLLMQSQNLRDQFGLNGRGIEPAFRVADGIAGGSRWLRQHPEVIAGVTIILVVARPAAVWRWGRRAYSGWQTWQRIQSFLAQRPSAL